MRIIHPLLLLFLSENVYADSQAVFIGECAGYAVFGFLISAIFFKSTFIRLICMVTAPVIMVGMNAVEDANKFTHEEKNYSYVSAEYPNNLTLVTVVETPISMCAETLDKQHKDLVGSCGNCKILRSQCRDKIPKTLKSAFNKEVIRYPYTYIPSNMPKLIVYKGFSKSQLDQGFSKMCDFAKAESSNSVCMREKQS